MEQLVNGTLVYNILHVIFELGEQNPEQKAVVTSNNKKLGGENSNSEL